MIYLAKLSKDTSRFVDLVKRYYLFLAVFGRRFWNLSDSFAGTPPFCLISDLIVSTGAFRPSIWFVSFSSGSFSSGRYRCWLCSTDVADEELSSSLSRRDRFDVMNLLFADFILRRRASVPSKLSPAKRDVNL